MIKLFDLYVHENCYYLVQELCTGGTLFSFLGQKEEINEYKFCDFFHQVLGGLAACHEANIVHWDLKEDNLMLTSESAELVKIIDFGLAMQTEPDSEEIQDNKWRGAMMYLAPETLRSKVYSGKSDMWQIGVILFITLSGKHPFLEGNNKSEAIRRILNYEYSFDDPDWDEISESAQDFISRLLIDHDSRMSAKEALEHPWI